jgi:hypothetical protein
VVKFRPKVTGVHEIRLVLTRSQLAGNFVAVASMRSGGYNVPRENIVESFSKVLAGAARIAQAPAVQQRGGLSFHESGNWSFYATVLKPNEKTSFAGLNLVKSPTIVLAGADSRARNVDLAVEDLTSSQLVGKDDGPDASAIVVLNTVVPNHNYRVSVANSGSNGPVARDHARPRHGHPRRRRDDDGHVGAAVEPTSLRRRETPTSPFM